MIVTPSVKTIPPINDAASKPEWGVHGGGETVAVVSGDVKLVAVSVDPDAIFVWFVNSLVDGVGDGDVVGDGDGVGDVVGDGDGAVAVVVDSVIWVVVGDDDDDVPSVPLELLVGADPDTTIKRVINCSKLLYINYYYYYL